MTPPTCCTSPLHVYPIHPLIQGVIAVAIVIVVVFLCHLAWRWSSGPIARHACRACNPESCGYCQREERDRRSSDYAREAREAKEARSAIKESLSRGDSNG